MDDESYEQIFKPVIAKVMEVYRPGAIVLQCGADSLAGDRLGCFNLSLEGHAKCVDFVKSFNVPLLVLGGGGYTVRNVARCWTYETAVLLGREIKDEMPFNDYFEYFGPEYRLHITPSNMENMNTVEYLEKHKNQILQNLSMLKGAPSVQMHEVPPDSYVGDDEEAADLQDPDQRVSIFASDKLKFSESEWYEDDFDQDADEDFDDL